MTGMRAAALGVAVLTLSLLHGGGPDVAFATVPVPVPPDQRGRLDAERVGFHDAANIRTMFWNFGMVGDYPPDPGNVDLSVFHSVEVPKGTGMNYSDGITPFVLTKIHTVDGQDVFLMETGFRERQQLSPQFNRVMRFEPRPGYFQPDPTVNQARSPAISNDPRTWPPTWPDRLDELVDPGWPGSWNGYFGKHPVGQTRIDQESFTVMDDDYYDAWQYFPDARDSTRHGLGLRVEVRGFQWANPQAGNVIFWHYDIANESTTDYDDIIFGLYMDSGVGGSAFSCDGIFESDDDNAFFDKSSRLNLVYTWDRFGHGRDLSGNCGRTGYLGYAYLETPGNPFDAVDNDEDGFVDERRDGGPGVLIQGQDEIRAYVQGHYDLATFEAAYGALESRAPYRIGQWWTGDEDMDWIPEFHDVGGDGVPATGDTGEGDGTPTEGEPNFDRTDLNESDQIGLTGFKMNRIKAGAGNPDPTTDGILFYTDANTWPARLYSKFTDPYEPARFDSALASNYNIGFLFASGPFTLKAGQRERFSLALAYGADLAELRTTVATVQQIYNANYQFAVPPPMPTLTAEAGDGFVQLSWDDVAERGVDPVTGGFDFEGYKIYRSTDPEFRDPEEITTGRGGDIGLRKAFIQFDRTDGVRGYSQKAVEGVQFWLGDETGITHTWTDHSVTNGQAYYYGLVAYDFGVDSPYDSLRIFPSQNAIAVTRTARGGLILPKNVVAVRPNPRALGFARASVDTATHVLGAGVGQITVDVVNSTLVSEGHLFKLACFAPSHDSLHATRYLLSDSTSGVVCFENGTDFDATGTGSVGCGLLPKVTSIPQVRVNTDLSGFEPGSPTNVRCKAAYQPIQPINLRRPGFPDNISIVFDDVVRDTGKAVFPFPPELPAKFRVLAHSDTGDIQLDFVFRDGLPNGTQRDSTLSRADERIDILCPIPNVRVDSLVTWRVQLDTLGQGARGPIQPPRLGDVYTLRLDKPLGEGDVFTFTTRGARVDAAAARLQFQTTPYVVPNPYVGAASFEPAPFNISGRGERRIEFRGLPSTCTIRIYTVRGDLVQTLRHENSLEGFVAWNLRTKDNLETAPGLYIFHVDAPGAGTHVGKFAIIK